MLVDHNSLREGVKDHIQRECDGETLCDKDLLEELKCRREVVDRLGAEHNHCRSQEAGDQEGVSR